MITHETLKSILNEIPKETITKELNESHDWISLEVFVANAGHTVQLESRDYTDDSADEIIGSGNIFCDKDDFLSLLEDNEVEYTM
jgi:hypothetical protein